MFAVYSTDVFHSRLIHWIHWRDWMCFRCCFPCPRTAPACSFRMQCLWQALSMAHMRSVCILFKQYLVALMVSLLLGRNAFRALLTLQGIYRPCQVQSVSWNKFSHTHWSKYKHSSRFKTNPWNWANNNPQIKGEISSMDVTVWRDTTIKENVCHPCLVNLDLIYHHYLQQLTFCGNSVWEQLAEGWE